MRARGDRGERRTIVRQSQSLALSKRAHQRHDVRNGAKRGTGWMAMVTHFENGKTRSAARNRNSSVDNYSGATRAAALDFALWSANKCQQPNPLSKLTEFLHAHINY